MSPAKKSAKRKTAAKASSSGGSKPKARAAAKSSAKKAKKSAKKASKKPSPARKASAKKAAKPSRSAKSKSAKSGSKTSKKAAVKKTTASARSAVSKKTASKSVPKKTAAKKDSKSAAAGKAAPKKGRAAKSDATAKPAPVTHIRSVAEFVSTHPRLGNKFDCFSCDAKFYDLNKPDPVCPKCGVDQRDKPLDVAKASAPKAKAKGRASRAVRPMAPLLDDDDGVAVEDESTARNAPKTGEALFDDTEAVTEEDADEE